MALTVTLTGKTVTLDETAGLQNSTVTPNVVGDADDNDTALALPAEFSTRLTTLGADPATAINAAVSDGNVIDIGGFTTFNNIAFTDANGVALNGASSGLFTNDGDQIFLFTDTGNDNIVLGRVGAGGVADPSGAIVLAVFIEQTGTPTVSGGKFWSIQYEALEHPDATNPDDSKDLSLSLNVTTGENINFGFAGAPSGSNLFMTFGDPTKAQIVVIGQDPLNQSDGGNITTKDVLNISQAGSTTSFGVNGNQINPDEGAFITYVTGANKDFLVPNLDQNEADVEANIQFKNTFDATGASFTVNQTNPGKGPITVHIEAFTTAAEPGVDFVDGLTNDTHVNIKSASFVNFVVKGEASAPVTTVNADGTLTITGLTSGDVVKWTTDGNHNRVLIENISDADGISGNDNNTFDIGGFSLFKALTPSDESLPFTVQIADADGDTAVSNVFTVGIDGNHDGFIT
jgi:Domain of unknown function (DUF5801)